MCRVLANLPEEVHWLCKKVEPGPGGRQIIPDKDEATRIDSTMHAIMLLSFSDQEANQQWLKGRIGEQLARCPRCVEEFYSMKRRFYQKLLPCVHRCRPAWVAGTKIIRIGMVKKPLTSFLHTWKTGISNA